MKIGIQGELGAYSHIAVENLYKNADIKTCSTFEDTFKLAYNNQNYKIVIPIENSLAGRVADIHYLLPKYKLQIHGEYFLDDPEINTTVFGTPKRNSYAEPIALIYLAVYLLIANILLLNLLVAIFNSTYEKIMQEASQHWRFHRYRLIMEYARRCFLCPPFSLITHLCNFIKWFLSLCETRSWEPSLKPKAAITTTKKSQLRALESNCLVKLVREGKRHTNLDSPVDGYA